MTSGFEQLHMLSLLFAIAVTAHNLEEAMFLPGWDGAPKRWRQFVSVAGFRFAVIVLTLVCYGLVVALQCGSIAAAYTLAGYALAMCLNVFVPHLALCLSRRRYAPGTATGVLLVLPAGLMLIRQTLMDGVVSWEGFRWTGPLVVVAMAIAVPALVLAGQAAASLWRRSRRRLPSADKSRKTGAN